MGRPTTAGSARPSGCPVAGAPGGRAVRREPVADRRQLPAPPRAGARPARPPARPAGRGARRRSAATGSSSSSPGQGATGAAEERGSRVADALDVPIDELRHAWEHGLARALGEDDRRRLAAGGPLRCAACSGSSCRPAAEAEAAHDRRPRACSPSSTAARSRPAIAVSDGRELMLYKDLGMIASVLDERRLPSLRGNLAIAHCRYSTTGSTVWENAQPTFRLGPAPGARGRPQRQPRQHPRAARPAPRRAGPAARLDRHGAADRAPRRRAGRRHGRGARSGSCPGSAAPTAWSSSTSAGSSASATRTASARSSSAGCPAPRPGRRRRPSPGLWGDDDATAGWILSSETTGLDIVGAEYVRDVEPGEIVVLEAGSARRARSASPRRAARCASSSSSTSPGPTRTWRAATSTRPAGGWGCSWPTSIPVETDLVMPVPDTGAPAAAGYAERSGIPYREGLVRNRYTGRTFIQPSQTLRHRGVTMKLNPLREVVRGQRLTVVDDSIVRGHDDAADRRPAPPGRREPRSTSGSAPRRSTTPASTGSTPRSRPSSSRRRKSVEEIRDVHRRRLARLPLDRRRPRRPRPALRPVLLRLLRRQLPGARPVRRPEPQVRPRGGARRRRPGAARPAGAGGTARAWLTRAGRTSGPGSTSPPASGRSS